MTFGKAVILRSYLGQKSPKHRFTKPSYDGTSLPTCNWIMFAAFQSVFGQLMTVLWHTALVACLSTNIRLLPLQSGKLNHQSINQSSPPSYIIFVLHWWEVWLHMCMVSALTDDGKDVPWDGTGMGQHWGLCEIFNSETHHQLSRGNTKSRILLPFTFRTTYDLRLVNTWHS